MADTEISREQEIEKTVRIAAAFLAGSFSAPPDDPCYSLAQGIEGLAPEELFERLHFLVSTKIPDVTVDEVLAAGDAIGEGYAFDAWIISQLNELRERHHWPEEETVGAFLSRAAAAGDEQAQKLMEMGILNVETSPRPVLCDEEGAA